LLCQARQDQAYIDALRRGERFLLLSVQSLYVAELELSLRTRLAPVSHARCMRWTVEKSIARLATGSADNSALLGMKRIKGAYKGKNITEVVISILDKYNIALNLRVFIADNVDLNNTAIRAILTAIRPDLKLDTRRSRCLGHIINLAAKAFIFNREVDAFKSAVGQIDETEAIDSDQMKKT
jgi:hypothetical protein